MAPEQINDRLATKNVLVQRGPNGKLRLFKIERGAGYAGYDKLVATRVVFETVEQAANYWGLLGGELGCLSPNCSNVAIAAST